MLTKQDLNQIQKIVDTASEKFAISLAPSFTNIFERLDKIEVRLDKVETRLDSLEEKIQDLGMQIDGIERKIFVLFPHESSSSKSQKGEC